MAFITVEDLYGSIECVAFPRVYEKIKPFLGQDTVVKLSGKLDIPAEKLPVIVVDNLEEFRLPENTAPQTGAQPQEKEKVLWLDARNLPDDEFEELLDVIEGYAGSMKTKILHDGKRFEFSVNPSRAFLAEIRTFLPEECVKIV